MRDDVHVSPRRAHDRSNVFALTLDAVRAPLRRTEPSSASIDDMNREPFRKPRQNGGPATSIGRAPMDQHHRGTLTETLVTDDRTVLGLDRPDFAHARMLNHGLAETKSSDRVKNANHALTS